MLVRLRQLIWTDATTNRWRAIRLMPRASLSWSVALAALLVVGAVLPPFFAVATGDLVRAATSPDHRDVGRLVLIVGVLYAAMQAIGPTRGWVTVVLSRRFEACVKRIVMAATLRPSGVLHLEDPEVLDKVELAQGVSIWQSSPARAVTGLAELWSIRLMGVGSMVLVLRFRWWLVPIIVVAELTSLRALRRSFLNLTQEIGNKTGELRRSSYFRDLALGRESAKETRVFGLGPFAIGRYDTAWLALMAGVWRERRRGSGLVAIAATGNVVGAVFALAVVSRAGLRGEIDAGSFVTYASAVVGAANIGATLGNADLDAEQGVAAIQPALELDRITRDERVHQMGGTASADGLPREAIGFEGVAFTYPGRDSPVFEHLDLEIRAGESLAIVGENGAGKTTIVKLLARLYDPDGGRIVVDGVSLQEIDPRGWQRRVAAIFQDFVHWGLSAADNVGFGAVDRLDDRAALERAAARAGALDLIEDFDHGWDTILNRQFDGGVEVSGGQWQRIALARALFAVEGGAGVLVLDEPTAQLDVRREAELYDRFLDLTHGLTTIVISHRFSTVRRADRIVVIEGGRVVEDGTHDALLAANGGYAGMFRLQADRFDDADAR